MNTALDAVIVMNDAGAVGIWDRQAEIIFGWSKKGAVAGKWHSWDISDRKRIEKALENARDDLERCVQDKTAGCPPSTAAFFLRKITLEHPRGRHDFKRLGFECDVAVNDLDAVQMTKTGRCLAIIMDVHAVDRWDDRDTTDPGS